jgi:hypothetical protein
MDVLGAAAGSNEIALWRNDAGNPIVWTKQTISQNFAGARSVIAARIDEDSLPDIVGAAFNSNQITWWQNAGGVPIVWVEHTIDGSFGGAHKVQAADIDGDGDLDVVGAAYMSNEIAVWFNDLNQQGTWTKQTVDANCYGALGACAVDLDRDRRVDILGTSDQGDDVLWWINNGGTPITWTEYVIDGSFDGAWPVTACDLDRDGDLDILSCAYNADDIACWENNLPTGVEDTRSTGDILSSCLLQNYPNPFNPSTTIKYDLPKDLRVTLKVFNVLGQEVATLVNEEQKAGYRSVEWNAAGVASGVYFYRLDAGSFTSVKKLLLLK